MDLFHFLKPHTLDSSQSPKVQERSGTYGGEATLKVTEVTHESNWLIRPRYFKTQILSKCRQTTLQTKQTCHQGHLYRLRLPFGAHHQILKITICPMAVDFEGAR